MKTSLKLSQVSKKFTPEAGVYDLEFEVSSGEGFSLLGPSGCGKSSTLRLIGGFDSPDSGQIHQGSEEITHLPPQKRNIRTVFQKYAIFPHLSVEENIRFGLRMQKVSAKEMEEKVAWAFDLLEIHHLKNRNTQKLSGGEQQRLALARALVTNPSILLLDEPLSALDLKLREKMQLELLALRKKLGTTFIFVTHDQTEAMALSDRIAVMKKGRIEQIGTSVEIYQKPKNRFIAEFIGQANFLSKEKAAYFSGPKEKLGHIAEKTSWMVRPENLRLSAAEGDLSLAVLIKEVIFLGNHTLVKAEDIQGDPLLLKGSPQISLQENQKTTFYFSGNDLWPVSS